MLFLFLARGLEARWVVHLTMEGLVTKEKERDLFLLPE
jgi:hypothetical protein